MSVDAQILRELHEANSYLCFIAWTWGAVLMLAVYSVATSRRH